MELRVLYSQERFEVSLPCGKKTFCERMWDTMPLAMRDFHLSFIFLFFSFSSLYIFPPFKSRKSHRDIQPLPSAIFFQINQTLNRSRLAGPSNTHHQTYIHMISREGLRQRKRWRWWRKLCNRSRPIVESLKAEWSFRLSTTPFGLSSCGGDIFSILSLFQNKFEIFISEMIHATPWTFNTLLVPRESIQK